MRGGVDQSPVDGEVQFDLVASKLERPYLRVGTAVRDDLITRLEHLKPIPLVAVIAPAGYGKTTLLAQWSERDGRAFAWVSVEERDNDPKVLLNYIATALDRVERIDRSVFDALSSVGSSVPGTVVPRLCAAFAAMTTPAVLVLDDVHLLGDMQTKAALSVLAEHVPDGSLLVLAGRAAPPVRVARLRAEGRILEIGASDLALNPSEAGALLRAAGVDVDDAGVAQLHERTEGWPAGLYLAALALRSGGSSGAAPSSFGGDDRLVVDYVESEFLDRLPRHDRSFLTRTSVLERLSGPLCDALLEETGSAAVLEHLAASNLMLVALDRRGGWFRYHHLLRDVLRSQLERNEPVLAAELRRRAAAWHERHDGLEEALDYSIQAEDVEAVARALQALFPSLYTLGRTATLRRWYAWLDDHHGIDRNPMNAINAAFLAATTGRAEEAERWADRVERWHLTDQPRAPDAYTLGMTSTLRAMVCRGGIAAMRADSDEAARRFADASFYTLVTPLLQGTARLLSGEVDEGDAFFAAVEAADLRGWGSADRPPTPHSADMIAMNLCERALVALSRHQWENAEEFAQRAHTFLREGGRQDCYAGALAQAIRARVAHHRGELAAARQALVDAARLRPLMTYAHPHWAVQCRITLVRAHLSMGDPAGARTILREIDDILARRPDLGTLSEEGRELRAALASSRGRLVDGASSLTAAELRVLPLLTTHLTYQEIADELFLSKHTIHAQTRSLFRKLGATSRSEAVARSRELSLLEG